MPNFISHTSLTYMDKKSRLFAKIFSSFGLFTLDKITSMVYLKQQNQRIHENFKGLLDTGGVD